VQDHFFNDCNGRTARLVADWILIANGLPPARHATLSEESYLHSIDPPERGVLCQEQENYMKKAVESAEKWRLRHCD